MKWTKIVVVFCIIVLNQACATPDPEPNLRVDPAAYNSDGFTIQRSMPYHPAPDHKTGPFFFKECSATGNRSYYSKTTFFCETRLTGF